MDPVELAKAWSLLDREYLAGVARRGPAPVFATVSGAHLYGFASPHGDVDLDWVAHDLRKFVRLLTSHNGYVLEQLFSPLVVVSTPAFKELLDLDLGRGCVTRPTVRHYLGFARGRRQRLREPAPTVKHLLYAYRVLLTGINMMRTGEVVANLPCLARSMPIEGLSTLMERKRAGTETMRLAEGEIEEHGRRLDGLEETLQAAHEKSGLPERPTTAAALEDIVVRLRLASTDAVPGLLPVVP